MCPCVHTGYLTASKKKEQQLQAELDTIRRMYRDKDQQISRLEQEQKGEQHHTEGHVHDDNQ